MDEPFVIAGYSIQEWLASAHALALTSMGDARILAGLLLIPALLSLFASSSFLTIGLLGFALTFLIHIDVLASASVWQPFVPVLFVFSGIVTVIGGFKARTRSRTYRSECERLEAETQVLQRNLERERLWRAAGGSSTGMISDDELREIRARLDRHLEGREGSSVLSEPSRNQALAPAVS